ncbi:alpha-(1-2)-phosphatidylinositol mannosyltransferase [Mycolicibacter nonchromogenicus]|uniref:Alpha-(1-2)-phosphatidylinositol mannosyltransferase n=1 Tax=Mycolicibacter nonchromogenicus TaxID=1782 RepID=A0A1X1Z6M5_MYCNO|nr:glycosyltransferase 87 family protein [Mycolicibacter nonchromogenicus]ORW18900.1 alpha-(1-2)-phosphatidylinositol mannosyltransferase [Mycolicibacter nonchromogenicus]
MTTSRPPDPGRRHGGISGWAVWWTFTLLAVAALGYTTWRALGSTPYHIDVDVYRMAAQAWREGLPLYGEDWFQTKIEGTVLPFTYPPIAAVMFAPLTWVSLGAATAALTIISTLLLVVSITIVLTGLGVRFDNVPDCGPAWWHRAVVATAIVAASIWLDAEPIWANFDFGQVNAVLMTLVIADCVPRRTYWPRGALLGVAVALKLTPAVFLLYFLLRRDRRAALTTVASFLAATLVGFVMAWSDSWQYWTHTVRDTDRIGGASLNTNQNLAGALARLPLGDQVRSVLWLAGCLLVLALMWWAARRVLAAGEPILALVCVALFGLVVSPVSWSHHWVWMLPTVVVTAVVAYRHRAVVLGGLSAAGVALMMRSPIELLPEHHEAGAVWWRQLAGTSYVWWALAIIITAGATLRPGNRTNPDQPAAVSGNRATG